MSVSETTYRQLVAVQRDYGFKNLCEVVTALLSLFLKRIRKVSEAEPLPEDDEDTIREMFDEFENWEPRPEAGHAPQIRRKRGT